MDLELLPEVDVGQQTGFRPDWTIAPQAPVQRDPSAEFDQLKGQFLAMLNYEMRTPLSGVLGMADLLLETSLDTEQREYVNSLRDCAGQLLEILSSVLDYSAWTAGALQVQEMEFSFRAVLQSVFDETVRLGEAKGLAVHAEWEEGLPETMVGDEAHLAQLLRHLLRNAVKFTERGDVRFLVSLEANSSPPFTRQWVRFEVRDTGIGIQPERISEIFESFRQLDSGLSRAYPGLGLGLALANKIAKLMGGDIQVKSQPGVGSSFVVRVPFRLPPGVMARFAPSAAGEADDSSAAKPVHGWRVLIIDDNRIAQQVMAHVLRKKLFEVSFADGGIEGAEIAARARFDLILMDMEMPELDGIEATKLIRKLPGYAHTPIIAVTANYSDEQRAMCYQFGMVEFVVKPIDRRDLLRKIERALRGDAGPSRF